MGVNPHSLRKEKNRINIVDLAFKNGKDVTHGKTISLFSKICVTSFVSKPVKYYLFEIKIQLKSKSETKHLAMRWEGKEKMVSFPVLL